MIQSYDTNTALTLKEVQQAAFEILVELDLTCHKLGLVYTLTYGTLIGAVRHKGFIPWDDDIDILMPREDYEKLKRYFKTDYKGNLLWCDRASVKNYPYCISRISDMNYRYYTSLENQKDFDIGVFVDIYPLDNYCDTQKQALHLGRKVWFKNRLFDFYINPNKTKGLIKIIIRNSLSVILKMVHGNKWQQNIDDEILSLIRNETNNTNPIVGVISQYEWKELMKKEWFSSYSRMEFCGQSFMVCNGYHELLTSIYGDYMQLPDESKRVPTHNYVITPR